MVRWYAAYMCLGHSATKAAQVKDGVNQYGLKDSVPLMRVERSSRGQFYLFLAIDGEGDDEFPVPDSLARLEQYAGLGQRLPIPLANRDDIDGMSVSPIDIEAFFDRIPRRVSPIPVFQPMGEHRADHQPDLPVLAEEQLLAQNRLLVWCSAKGSGSWSQFLDACLTLGCVQERQFAKRLQRRLRLLGHIETTNHGHWSVAPAALVRSGHKSASEAVFLCGQRTGQMTSAIANLAQVTVDPQPYGDAPSRVSAESEESLGSIIGPLVGPLRHVGDVSALLAANLKSLKQWESSLDQFPYVFNNFDYVIGSYTVKKYGLSEFHECSFKQEVGLYELSPKEHDGGSVDRSVTGYYSQDDGSWHRGDWYGLRFLAKVRANEAYSYDYDAATGVFSIPQEWRWPEVYERALVLSSGYLPLLSGSRITYKQIDETTLSGLHQKLEVTKL